MVQRMRRFPAFEISCFFSWFLALAFFPASCFWDFKERHALANRGGLELLAERTTQLNSETLDLADRDDLDYNEQEVDLEEEESNQIVIDADSDGEEQCPNVPKANIDEEQWDHEFWCDKLIYHTHCCSSCFGKWNVKLHQYNNNTKNKSRPLIRAALQ